METVDERVASRGDACDAVPSAQDNAASARAVISSTEPVPLILR